MSQADQQFLDALRYLGSQGQAYGVKLQMDQVNQRANEIRSTMDNEIQRRQAMRQLASQAAISVAGSGGNATQTAALNNLMPPIPSSVQEAYLTGQLTGDTQMVDVAKQAMDEEEKRKIRLMEKQNALDLLKLRESNAGTMGVEMRQVRKENRKTFQELQAGREQAVRAVSDLKEIQKLISGSTIMGTGPIDQVSRYISPEAQRLEQLMSKLSLSNMVKMFDGMSKAVDTGAERAAFEKTQLSLGKYEATNLKDVQEQLKLYQSLIKKTDAKINSFKASGGLTFDLDDVGMEDPDVQRLESKSDILLNIKKRQGR